MEWGPWQYSGLPEVGAYVQVEGYWEHTLERYCDEGIIAGYDGSIGWFVGQPRPSPGQPDAIAERWREAKLPEHKMHRKEVARVV